MDASDDPYELLGITNQADAAQIRAAYRKAALRHHPDKQRTEQDKLQANVVFAKISNAYEILSDPGKRREYDVSIKNQQQQQQHHHHTAGYPAGPVPGFEGDYVYDDDDGGFPHFGHYHPFGAAFGGGPRGAAGGPGGFQFHDPFQVFEQVFREEFGGTGGHPFHSMSRGMMHHDPFAMMGMHDPFMMGHPAMNRRGGPGGFADPFHNMFMSMHQMHNDNVQQDDPRFGVGQQQPQQRLPQGSTRSFVYSNSSSSSFGGGGLGESVTTRTTTQIVNGQEQTVTERIVRKADGTVERHVETVGGGDHRNTKQHPMLSTAARATALPASQQQQQENAPGWRDLLPVWGGRSSSSQRNDPPPPASRSSTHTQAQDNHNDDDDDIQVVGVVHPTASTNQHLRAASFTNEQPDPKRKRRNSSRTNSER